MLHLSKKILIGVALVGSYLITLGLSLIITPPYPDPAKINQLISRINNIKTPTIHWPQLVAIKLIPKLIPPLADISDTLITSNQLAITPVPPGADISPVWSKPTFPPAFPTSFPVQSTVPPDYPYPTSAPTTQLNPTFAPNYPSITRVASNPPQPTTPPTFPNYTPIPTTPSQPTTLPRPSNTPRPPRPTATPPLTLGRVRPGKNLDDAISIISPIICVPRPMLRAVIQMEYGAWLSQLAADWTNRNTYQGYDPADSAPANQIMGVMRMMAQIWRQIKPYVSAKVNNSPLAINVTFDAILGAGYHLRNISLAMKNHISCDDWPANYILYGACRYNGACPDNTFGQSQYYNFYTYSVCNYYNQFTTGPKKNCH